MPHVRLLLLPFVLLLSLGWTTEKLDPTSPVAWEDLLDATNSNQWLNVSACPGDLTVYLELDPDDDGILSTATIYIRTAAVEKTLCTDGTLMTPDSDGDGVLTASDEQTITGAVTGRRGWALPPQTFYACIDRQSWGADIARVTARCS